MKFLWHACVLLLSFGLVFIWQQSDLGNYTVQALAFLVASFLIISFIRRRKNPQAEFFSGTADIFILNTSILLLLASTGNLYSPLFFLLYFLGFGIAFIFEPVAVLVFTFGSIAIFLPEALKNGSIESFIRLGSLILIAPLAFFFGQEYRDRDEQEEEIEAMEERTADAANTISEDIEDIITHEKDTLSEKDIEKLNEVLEETEILRQDTKE